MSTVTSNQSTGFRLPLSLLLHTVWQTQVLLLSIHDLLAAYGSSFRQCTCTGSPQSIDGTANMGKEWQIHTVAMRPDGPYAQALQR